MLNRTSLRLCQSLFLIAVIIFQSLAVASRERAFVKATEKKTASTATLNQQKRSTAPPLPQRTPVPNTPQAAAITATNRDSFPNHGDGKAHQGDTITYSVAITNTGDANATGVNFTDTVDVNTSTLVGGSPTIQFTVAGDTYSAIGNVKIDTSTIAAGSGQSVLENDTTSGATLTGFGSTLANANGTVPNGSNTVTTANGGVVTMNADGSFKYNPGAGFSGADSFWYTLTKNTVGTGNPTGFPSGAARVTINVSTPIWFVDQAAAAGGDGRLATPFNCLGGAGCFNAVNNGAAGHPAAGHFIFLYKSSGAPAAFTGGVDLLNNQKLIGEGASASLATIVGVSLPPGSNALPATGNAPPVLTTASLTDNIRLGTGNSNTLRGFTVGDSGGANGDSSDISGTNIGTLTVSEVTLNGTGRALRLTGGGTLAATFLSVTCTKASGEGINLATIGGNATMGSTTISNTGNEGIKITGSSLTANFGTTSVTSPSIQGISISTTTGNITFGATTVTNGTEGINLSGNSAGTRTFASLSVTGQTGGSFIHSNNGSFGGGDVIVTGTATLSCAGNPISVSTPSNGDLIDFQGATSATSTGAGPTGVNWTGAAGAAMQFNALTIQTNGGIGLNATGGGTITVTNGTGTINNTTQAASAIIANGVALNANFSAIKSSGGTNGVSLTNVTGTSNFGTGALSGGTGSAFLVSGGSATVSFGGTITQNTAAQKAVAISGITGGAITLSGAITSNGGSGISAAGTGGTITISGGMTLNGTASVFSATGSGMIVNVTGTNTVGGTTAVTSGTAVNITCTIGASGVTFQKVASTGVATGIVLTSTGSGNFTITGNGALNCKTTAANCDGGTVQTSTGPGMNFTTVGGSISLTNMNVTGGSDDGIRGNGVGSFTLTTSQVTNNGNATTERGIELTNVGGSGGVSNSTVTGNAEDDLWIQNNNTNLTAFNVTNSTFSNTSTSVGNDGVHIEGLGNSNMTFSVTGSTFNHNRGDHFQVTTDAVSAATMNATFTGNTLTGDRGTTYGGTDLGGSITINPGGTANITCNLSNNNITGATSSAITLDSSNSSHIHGTLSNNIIGTAGTIDSGSSQGDGISIFAINSSTLNALVTGNTIKQYSNLAGIDIKQSSGSASIQAVVTGNTVSNGGTFAAQAIIVVAGAASGDSGTMCLDLGGAGALANSFAGAGANGSTDFRVRQRMATTVRLPGYGGTTTNTAAVVSFISGRNTGSPSGNATVNTATSSETGAPFGGGFIGGAACTAPLQLAERGIESAGFFLPRWSNFGVTSSLDQAQLNAIVAAATLRWKVAGLTPSQIRVLRGIKFEVTDLAGSYLGEADGNRILVDRDAQGKGWFIDATPLSDSSFIHSVSATHLYTDRNYAAAGHVDLLTAVEHEMGHRLELNDTYAEQDRDSIMYGYLTVGERRVPAPGQAKFARANYLKGVHFLRVRDRRLADPKVIRKVTLPEMTWERRDNQPVTPQSGGTVNLSIGTITPGSTVVLTYQVTVNNAAPAGAGTISNQGTITSSAPTVSTDDPDTGAAGDATITPLLHPTAANGTITGRITDANGRAVEGAVVYLSGSQSRKLITDAKGNYRFDNVDTGGFYMLTPSRANYSFNPFNRSFSLIGNNTEALFTGTMQGDNTNPLDTAEFFVRQQYVDVLSREPDEAGFNYWSDRILDCGDDASCARARRVGVAAAFFIEQEAQQTGVYIYDVYAGALGRRPVFAEYQADRGQVVGGGSLDTAKTVFARNFVQRPEFTAKYNAALTAESFVDALLQTVQSAGDNLSGDRANLIATYNQGSDLVTSRAAVIRSMAENGTFRQSQYNRAFVLTEYFAYLRRDIDQNGYDFWVGVLSIADVDNYRGMVCSFITSTEYQNRFSQVVSHSNSECQ